MINAAQKKEFSENGFLIFDGNFDPQKLRELHRIFEESKEKIQNYSGWAYMGMFRHSFHYLKFIEDCGALKVAQSLLANQKLDLYWDSVVVKSANNPREFCWHQDEGYTQTKPEEYLTFWIPFHDVDSQNGGLWVLPGSHKEGLLQHSPVKISERNFPGLVIDDFDDEGEMPISLKAGQVLVFSSLLAHRSGANNSEDDRLAMAFAIHKHGFEEVNVPSNLAPVEGLYLQ